MGRSTDPVTADDLDRALQRALATLREAPADAWSSKAGDLEWDCWATAEHLCDDMISYAARLGPRSPSLDRKVPFADTPGPDGGPEGIIHADRAAGPAGLLQMLEGCGALLVAIVRTSSPDVRAWHVHGISDPEGFAAMGIVETFAHTHDLAEGLGLTWEPPADLCEKALARLFPDAPQDTEPWPTLLWATGRGDLPGRPRLTGDWRWDGTVRAG